MTKINYSNQTIGLRFRICNLSFDQEKSFHEMKIRMAYMPTPALVTEEETFESSTGRIWDEEPSKFVLEPSSISSKYLFYKKLTIWVLSFFPEATSAQLPIKFKLPHKFGFLKGFFYRLKFPKSNAVFIFRKSLSKLKIFHQYKFVFSAQNIYFGHIL